MATAGYKARILLGDFALHAKLNQIDLPVNVSMYDVGVFSDPKRFIAGRQESSASMAGFHDTDGAAEAAAWVTATPFTYAPTGLAHGSQVQLVDLLRGTFSTSSPTDGAVAFTLDGVADGPCDFGVSLHDLGAETADENGTSHDGGAQSTTGAVAQLHVTEFSGFSGVAITVEDSANDSTFATIGTFTTIAGTTSERIAIAGTVRRYTRYALDVTGTGSITFQLSLARR